MKAVILLFAIALLLSACATQPTQTDETAPAELNITENTTEPEDSDGNPDPSEFDPTIDNPDIIVDPSAYEAREGYTPNLLTIQEFAGTLKRSGPYSVTLYGEDSEHDSPYEKTWYVDGKNLEYRALDTRYIENDDGTFVCTFAGAWSCEEGTYQMYSQLEASIRAAPSEFPIRGTGVRPYADTQGKCYVTELENVEATLCFEESGAPLRVEITTPSFESNFVATRYSDEAPETAFQLPGPLA